MPELSSNEIVDIVETLRADPAQTALRADVRIRLEQHAMTDIPYVPDFLLRSGKVQLMNSPRIADTARQINAVMSGYVTTTTVTPGEPSGQHKADELEKAYALRRQTLFSPHTRAIKRWEQLVVGYGLYHLVCGSPDDDDPWTIDQPDPLSCYFTADFTKSNRPTVLAREYRITARELSANYSDAREKRRPVYERGQVQWSPLTESQSVDSTPYQGTTIKGQMEQLDIYEYDDGEMCYVVALNRERRRSRREGTVVWQRPNLTGGCAYVIVPGYLTGSRELREKLLPHLWAPMNVQNQIDTINTLRATRSLNLKPQVLMERTPELMKAAQALGILRAAPDNYEAVRGDTIIELDGKPHFWQLPEDQDLAMLEASKLAELDSYINTELSLTRGDVIKESPVRNVQLALGARSQQQGPMLTAEDMGETEILKMWAHSITCEGGYGADTWGLSSNTKALTSKSEIKPGTRVEVKAEDFKDFDHHVSVQTASLSEQERDFMIDAAAKRVTLKISTRPEMLDAAGYQNRAEQMDALVEEEAYVAASAFYGPWLTPTFEKRLAERHGILVRAGESGGLEGMPSEAGPAQPTPNAFPVPQTQGVQGGTGSGPSNTGGAPI